MKKKTPKNHKIQGATGSHFRVVKRTPRGQKTPERKKPLPPWRDVRDKLE